MIDRIMSSRKNCDCDISQLVVELFTKLLGILDHDCRRSQTYSRKYLPRKSGNGKKRKCGGAGSRHRRFEARHAGTARRTSTSSPVPDRAPPDRPEPPPPSPPPPLPPRSTSLIQDVCGVIIEPSPQQKEEKKKKMISEIMETSDVKERSKMMAKLGLMVHEEIISKISAEQRSEAHEMLNSREKKLLVDKEMSNMSDLTSKAVKQGQPARQCFLDPKQDVGLRRKTGQHTLDSSQTTFQPDQMHQNVTQFLKQASEVKNKEAENKIKLEKMKSTPGPGFQKTQNIPFNQVFCFMCMKYVEKIHYCSLAKKYFNIDVKNFFFIEGDTPDLVSGTSDNHGRCSVFKTKFDMNNAMMNRQKVQTLVAKMANEIHHRKP